MKSINKTMIEHAIKIAYAVKADSLLVCVDITRDIAAIAEEMKKPIGVIIVTREDEGLPEDIKKFAKKLD